MILNIMHHVQYCNRVLEVRRGLVVSTVLFPPTSLKYRVIKTHELCSCVEKKQYIIEYPVNAMENRVGVLTLKRCTRTCGPVHLFKLNIPGGGYSP